MTINSTASLKLGPLPGFADGIEKKAKSGAFADALKDAAEKKSDSVQLSAKSAGGAPTITESGKNSKGGAALTDVQKQYLRDKYHLTDSSLSDSQLDSLLAELTNMGVLSYQDCRMAGSAPTTPGVMIVIYSPVNPADKFASSKNYAEYFQHVIQKEEKEAASVREQTGGEVPFSYNDCIESHRRIENVLKSLF